MRRRRQITGLRVLVTGASQGIGRALALEAAQRGAKVLAAARSDELLAELGLEASQAGQPLLTVTADVTNPEGRQRMVEAARGSLGGLDVLINNAGLGASGHFIEADPERLRRIFDVNFFGMAETTRVLLPLLRQGRTPAILNICSIAGRVGIPARSEYSASKFAVQGFSEALRAELARFGIDVLVVNPGLVQTNFSKNMLEAKAKMELDLTQGMTARRVAELTLDALAKGKREVTLTWKGRLLVLVNRLFPWLVALVAGRRVRHLYKNESAAETQSL